MMENNENQKNMKILNVILKGEELLSSETANITGGADMETNTNEAAICLCTNDKQDNTNDATWVCIC